jgi:hypothetical protein
LYTFLRGFEIDELATSHTAPRYPHLLQTGFEIRKTGFITFIVSTLTSP